MNILLAAGLFVAFCGRIQASEGTLKSFEIGSTNCQLQEPLYGQNFDLRPLMSDLGHSVVTPSSDFITFNVCGKMKRLCANQTDVKACMKKPNGREIVMGYEESLFLSDGRIHFNFTGERCNANQNYTLNLILNCDYDTHEMPFNVFPYTNDQCTYFVLWTTSLACLKVPEAVAQNKACSVKDSDGHIFDLSPLSHENKKLAIDANHFLINICKPVLYKHLEMCPPGSSVCLVNRTEANLNDRFINLGDVVANPVIENDQLMMKFNSPTKCNATSNYTSTIFFSCDELNEFGEPEFLAHTDCDYTFAWSTSFACKRHSHCAAIDLITGFKFDMTPLAQKSYNLTSNGKNYFFSVCSETLEPCEGNSAACLTTTGSQTTSLGIASDYLHYNVTGSPYLLYEKGAKCNEHSYWSTKIEFVCGSGAMKDGPHIIEEKDCQLLIQYVTEQACQTNLTCRVETYGDNEGNVIDLSRLIKSDGNYEAAVNETLKSRWKKPMQFYLNVCRPLVPQYGLNCVGGSAACMATKDNSTNTAEEEESLGFPDVSLTMGDGQRPQLRYLRGTACAADPNTLHSTQIDFFCRQSAGLGVPVLQEILHDCHYRFDWATNIICPAFRSQRNDRDCVIHNEQIDRHLSLKDVFSGDKISLKDDKKDQTQLFDVNICNDNRNVTINYKESTVQIFIKADGKCGQETSFDVEIRLVCYKTPQQYSEREGSTCRMLFTQETPLVCPLLGIDANASIPVKPTNPTSDNHSSSAIATPIEPTTDSTNLIGVFAGVLLVSTVALSLMFVLKDADRRQYILHVFRKRGPSVQYSRVRSNEEASLLMDHPMTMSDSDDELLI